MATFIVEYTNQDCVGNQVLTMEIEADSLTDAYAVLDENYPNLSIDTVYPEDDSYDYDDGQPTEYDEWMSFDPDC
jgi:hypothetical protein